MKIRIIKKSINKLLGFRNRIRSKVIVTLVLSLFFLLFFLSEKFDVIKAQSKIEPIELPGVGQEATQKFSLEEGLVIFRMTHSGQANFIIWLLNNNGDKIELLVNEVGYFDGSKAVNIKNKGDYLLDISADGKWTVKIEQPSPFSAPSVPQNFTGKGQQVSEMFSLGKGLATFKMTHDGSENFIVWLLDQEGRNIELLVNEIGAFDGSKATGIKNGGIYLLDIAADGNWTINVGGEVFEPPSKKEPKEDAKDEQGESKDGCFIATAVYGPPLVSEVNILREFRDKILLENDLGREFVKFYYQNSPPIAEFISKHAFIRKIVRKVGIEPIVGLLKSTKSAWNE